MFNSKLVFSFLALLSVHALPALAEDGDVRFCNKDSGLTVGTTTFNCKIINNYNTTLSEIDRAFETRDYKEVVSIFDGAQIFRNQRPASQPFFSKIVSSLLEEEKFRSALVETIRREKILGAQPKEPFSLWSDFALILRRAALKRGQGYARSLAASVFREHKSKYASEIWSLIPEQSVHYILDGAHTLRSVFLRSTKNIEIRNELEFFIKENASDRFVSLAHYLIGDFEKSASTNSILGIQSVFAYADLHSKAQKLLPYYREIPFDLNLSRSQQSSYLDAISLRYDEAAKVAKDLRSAAKIFAQNNRGSKHYDDALFWAGWSDYLDGNYEEAVRLFYRISHWYRNPNQTDAYFDYGEAADNHLVNVLQLMPTARRLAIMSELGMDMGDNCSALSYVSARTEYRAENYELAHNIASKCLKSIKISDDSLVEITKDTNQIRINRILAKILNIEIDPLDEENYWQYEIDIHTQELSYIYSSSNLLMRLFSASEGQAEFYKKNRKLIEEVKYNYLKIHKDIRQVLAIQKKIIDSHVKTEISQKNYYEILKYAKQVSGFLSEKIVEKIISLDADSEIVDDAKAELMVVYTETFPDFSKASDLLKDFHANYTEANAYDNALDWYASAIESPEIDSILIKKYFHKRFALFAWMRKFAPRDGEDRLYLENALNFRTITPIGYYEEPRMSSFKYGVLPEEYVILAQSYNDDWLQISLGKKYAYILKSAVAEYENRN